MAYAPAPLDTLSIANGVAKYLHPQKTLPTDFLEYAEMVLDMFFPLMNIHSNSLTIEQAREITLDPDHAPRACGYPWDIRGCTTKLQAVTKFGEQFESCPWHFLNAVLKDELRPIGKDARLFRMQSVHDFEAAQVMYHEQNEYIASCIFTSPVFVKFATPGTDLSRLYENLQKFGDNCSDADANAWDANYPLAIAEFLCYWRQRYMPERTHERHRQYYADVYNGYTIVGGRVFHLVGQSSGHLNTTIDNSLGNIVAMSYVAWSNRLTLTQFVDQILFYVCGDDLIWSNRGVFTPREVGTRYLELGIYLEFTSFEPLPVLECTFVGTLPVQRDRIRYHGRPDKLQATMCFKKRSHTVLDVVSKMASVAMLSYYSDLYSTFKDMTHAYVMARAKENPAVLASTAIASYLRCMEPRFLDVLYNAWEVSSFYSQKPFSRVLKGLARLLKWLRP